ncbi:MAG: hypothetical protein CMC82_02600 [Flavobacteriaceae bacterium]|nr:hypothetical protein [Flavobacteriaceae bacterium]|tara:strand:- start:19 stop:426 length:408 start_codon:yes stop_codon:yes gene_type:complete
MISNPATIKYENNKPVTLRLSDVESGHVKNLTLDGQRLTEIHEVALRCEKLAQFVKASIVTTLVCFGVLTSFWIHYLYAKGTILNDFKNMKSAIHDTNDRVTYMINVRPGNRGVKTFDSWQHNGDIPSIPIILKD